MPRRAASSESASGVSLRACSQSSAAAPGAPRARARSAASSSAAATSASGPPAESARCHARSSGSLSAAGEALVQRAAPRGRDAGVGDGREERVGEAQALAVALDDAGRLGVRERGRGLVGAQRGLDVGGGRPRQRRRDVDRLARRGRQRVEPAADELLHARRQRQLRAHGRARVGQGPRDLEREERVAGGLLVQARERAAVEREVEPLPQQGVQLGPAEGADEQALQRQLGERVVQRRGAAVGLDAPRHEHADRLVAQPADGEGERELARLVEPLRVVDRDQHRPVGGDRAQRREQAQRHRARQRRLALRLRAQERDVHGEALRARQAVERRSRAGRRAGRRAPRRPGPPRAASGRQARTRTPRAAAASTAPFQSVVLPMPGSPSTSSAAAARRGRVEERVDAARFGGAADHRAGMRRCGDGGGSSGAGPS